MQNAGITEQLIELVQGII